MKTNFNGLLNKITNIFQIIFFFYVGNNILCMRMKTCMYVCVFVCMFIKWAYRFILIWHFFFQFHQLWQARWSQVYNNMYVCMSYNMFLQSCTVIEWLFGCETLSLLFFGSFEDFGKFSKSLALLYMYVYIHILIYIYVYT